jgi:hypothetical protein
MTHQQQKEAKKLFLCCVRRSVITAGTEKIGLLLQTIKGASISRRAEQSTGFLVDD